MGFVRSNIRATATAPRVWARGRVRFTTIWEISDRPLVGRGLGPTHLQERRLLGFELRRHVCLQGRPLFLQGTQAWHPFMLL